MYMRRTTQRRQVASLVNRMKARTDSSVTFGKLRKVLVYNRIK